MCQFSVGQPVKFTGRIFCKDCGQVCNLPDEALSAKFFGHDGGFDVFDLSAPVVCPWCLADNPSFEKPCDDPIVLAVEEAREEVYREDRS